MPDGEAFPGPDFKTPVVSVVWTRKNMSVACVRLGSRREQCFHGPAELALEIPICLGGGRCRPKGPSLEGGGRQCGLTLFQMWRLSAGQYSCMDAHVLGGSTAE